MTSLAAWVAVDNTKRGPEVSSVYLASDSRITFDDGTWDQGQKLFASSRTADVFGFAGAVTFPTIALGQVIALLETGALVGNEPQAQQRHEAIQMVLRELHASYRALGRGREAREFSILHASRTGHGPGQDQFHLWSTRWADNSWDDTEVRPLPAESTLVLAVGSGRRVVETWNEEWQLRAPGTSRAVFSAFCDALNSDIDGESGGGPQLVGLWTKGAGRRFGVAVGGTRFIGGVQVPRTAHLGNIAWFDQLFRRCDGDTLLPLEPPYPAIDV